MRLIASLAVAASIAVALISSALTVGVTSGQTGDACPPNPSPPDAADPSIIVAEPGDGDTVTPPVPVSGQARVFEANVRITIFGTDGDVLADTFTTAEEGAPALAPFSTNVDYDVSDVQAGCIRVFEESAQDGSPVNVVQVEVNLAPAKSPEVTPPDTGTGGLDIAVGAEDVWFVSAGAALLVAAAALALHRRLWE